ncbi:hypothetical protein DL769_006987 [Monosporascus sp. CRB-8-3]|nr:hypothetical protein DL769_006987 [Monosporascus sp. CRB-8-3]
MPVKRIVPKKSPSGASKLRKSPGSSPEGAATAEDGFPARRTGMVTRSMTRNARVKRIKLVNRNSPAALAVPAVAPDGSRQNPPSVIKMFSNGRISLIRHVAENHLVYRRSDDQNDVVEYYHEGRLFKLWDTRTRLVIYESLADHPIVSSGGRDLQNLYYDVYYRHYHFTYPLELLEEH